ncbi:hypothetical protein GGH99_003974 [Coemansia sp. RSA 1285]|nr:hypothetical protein GGH99_003974 [Coemansia sp. RSA 1285]
MPLATTSGSQQNHYRPGTLRDTRAFAQLSQFIWLFQEPLKIENVDLDRLESELCNVPSEREEESETPILMQAIKRSLRILTGNRSMEDRKMDGYIARVWEKYMVPYGRSLPPDYGDLGLFGLGAGDRTRIALDTCELVFCRPDNLRSIGTVASKLAEDPVQWRTEPLGVDSLGRKYYLVCETNLYRETPKLIVDVLLGEASEEDSADEEQQVPEQEPEPEPEKERVDEISGRRRSTRLVVAAKAADEKKKRETAKAENKHALEDTGLALPSAEDIEFADPPQHRMREDDGDMWELVCSSVREWTEYPKVFCRSRKKNERALYKTLADIGPSIVQRLSSAARRRQTREAMLHRKRSSRIALRQLLHDEAEAEAEAEARVYNGSGSYSSEYSSGIDGSYVPGARRSKRLRSTRAGSLADGGSDALLAPTQRPSASRDARAQRRDEARKAAIDSAEAEKAVRKVAEIAAANNDGSQPDESYREAVDENSNAGGGEIAGSEDRESESVSDASDGGNVYEDRDADEWMFNCSCGKMGHNYDDGRAMTACEQCSVWRHLGCALRAEAQRIGADIDEDDWESMRYVCPSCRRAGEREAAASAASKPSSSFNAGSPSSFGHVHSNA